jgi:hypothetical protein
LWIVDVLIVTIALLAAVATENRHAMGRLLRLRGRAFSAIVSWRGKRIRQKHLNRNHQVLRSSMRDLRVKGKNEFDFYFRPSWYCLTCTLHWPRR